MRVSFVCFCFCFLGEWVDEGKHGKREFMIDGWTKGWIYFACGIFGVLERAIERER